jgi:hypothetical protein
MAIGHRDSADGCSRGTPAEGRAGGRTGRAAAVPTSRRTIRRGQYRAAAQELRRLPGACGRSCRRRGALGQRRACALVDPDDRSDDRHLERSVARSPGAVSCPAAPGADGADQRAWDARRRTRPANSSGPGKACGGYSEDTPKWAGDKQGRRAVIRRSSCRWPPSAVPATALWTVSQPYIYTSPRLR